MSNHILNSLETKNLLIKNSSLRECSDLQAICSNLNDKTFMEGMVFDEEYIYRCLTEGDFPPLENTSLDNYYLKSIYLKSSQKIIGFFDLYHGYPCPNTLWISVFAIDKAFQNKGYGNEIITELAKAAYSHNFSKLAVAVHLKNWTALQFWFKAGFNKVLNIYGDKTLNENSLALITLEYTLMNETQINNL